MRTEVDDAKQQVRERIWDVLDAAGAALDQTTHGRIPNFKGSRAAADRLGTLTSWHTARTIKAVPDKAQLAVRAKALDEAKTVTWPCPSSLTHAPSTSSTPPL
ncbi:hypothetical protein [Streptomyces sp. NBC_00356]|uniref:hypothetical protein n=1 Tax=Streptomyces sp. NBC_00356 TaxID=2975724 RepID=UPI002E259376